MPHHRSLLAFSVLAFLLSCSGAKQITHQENEGIIIVGAAGPTPISTKPTSPATPFDTLQVKYGRYLNILPEKIQNRRLYMFIDQWLATPYKWGGVNETGIDCSAFMQRLLSEVYNIEIPRTSVQQFFNQWIDRFGSTRYLAEGDLVFFRTINDKIISHVGLYLDNRMFINSSSSKGVSIACLDDPYWKRCYVGAGRVKVPLLKTKK